MRIASELLIIIIENKVVDYEIIDADTIQFKEHMHLKKSEIQYNVWLFLLIIEFIYYYCITNHFSLYFYHNTLG